MYCCRWWSQRRAVHRLEMSDNSRSLSNSRTPSPVALSAQRSTAKARGLPPTSSPIRTASLRVPSHNASAPWLVALVSISVGPLAALMRPWDWFFSTEMAVEKSEAPSPKPQFRGEEDGCLVQAQLKRCKGMHTFGASPSSASIGPAWLSTPGQAESLRSTGGGYMP